MYYTCILFLTYNIAQQWNSDEALLHLNKKLYMCLFRSSCSVETSSGMMYFEYLCAGIFACQPKTTT